MEVGLINEGLSVLSSKTRAEDFTKKADKIIYSYANKFDETQKTIFTESSEKIKIEISNYLADTNAFKSYQKALNFSSVLFWILAVLVGTVQGGIQSLSRSYFGKIIPPERSNEYFGFFDIFGKFSCIIGPAFYSIISNVTGRSSLGILSLIVLLGIGYIVLKIGRKHLIDDSHKEAVKP